VVEVPHPLSKKSCVPIARLSFVVRHRNNDNGITVNPIKYSVRKVFQEQTTHRFADIWKLLTIDNSRLSTQYMQIMYFRPLPD
jgi:hypothetical protein